MSELNNKLQSEIIERIKAEQSLTKSEIRYRSLFENMLEGFAYCKMLFDDKKNPVDFVYIAVNNAFEQLTGLKDVIGKKVTEVIPGIKELSPELFEIYGRVSLTGKPEKFELEFKPMEMYLSISVYSTEKEYFVAVFDNITEHKQAEEARKIAEVKLAKERNLLRTLIDNMPDRIYAKDTTGRFIICNKALVTRMGLTNLNEIVGKTDFDFLPYELAARFYADEQEIIRSGKPLINCEEPMDDASGATRWNLATKVPLRDEEGKIVGIIGLGREITERKRAEELLKESNEFNKSLLQTIPFGMDIIDETGNVLFFSNNLLDQFGKDALGKKCWELYRDDRTQCKDCPIKLEIKIGQTLVTESSGVMNGKIFQIHHTGMIFNGKKAMLEVFQDITERKSIELTLKESEEKYRQLIESQGEGIGLVDNNECFLFVNPAAEIIFGVKPGGLVGRNLHEFIVPELTSVISRESQKRSEGTKSTYEIDIINDLGNTVNLIVTATPQINKEGKFIGTFGVFRNITERKQAELQLAKYAEELKALNATKDKFFSIIAHDLRGPFNILLNLSYILTSEIDTLTKDEIKGYSNELRNSLARQYELLNNLLDWSKMQDGRFALKSQTIILHKEVNEVIELLALTASNKRIKLINNVEENISVFADINMLQLVLRNLISNSIKFTKKNGIVAVRAKKNDMFVEVEVSDNGIGISEDDLEKLFKIDISYSSKGTEDEIGTGLGLMLCKEIIEKHNGKIWTESEINKGSNFIFTIPANVL